METSLKPVVNSTEFQFHIKRRDHEKDIKNKCFLCGLKFENRWEYYCSFGNCCRWCSSNTSQGLKKTPGAKELATERLVVRRLEVKQGLVTKN